MSTTPGRDETNPSAELLEAALRPWLEELPSVEAPASLRARVLLGAEFESRAVGASALPADAAHARTNWFVRNWGFGAMGAAAALLLLALAVTTNEGSWTEAVTSPADGRSLAEGGSRTGSELAAVSGRAASHRTGSRGIGTDVDGAEFSDVVDSGVYVIQDPRLSLFHAVETFDGVDLAPGELIAGLDR